MADLKYYDVIKTPVLTEKSMNAMSEKKYTFLVHPDATKNQIADAVEKMFEGTKVAKVNTVTTMAGPSAVATPSARPRRLRRHMFS